MKKLGKLNIKPENLLKDEELQKLRGGWVGQCAVYKDGEYEGLKDWFCWGELCIYDWWVDQSCATYYSADYCFCNNGY